MMFSTRRPELVAIDDGFDHVKAVSLRKKERIATAYALNPAIKVAAMAVGDTTENVYEIAGRRYAVGPNVVSCDTRFEDFPYDAANLAVAMDAIRRVVEPGQPVNVIVGLPFDRFYLFDGQINESAVSRKSAAWNRPVTCLRGGNLPKIEKVTVIAEAVAAWFDFVINDDFTTRDDVVSDLMAVVDIGGRTTDIAVFQNGEINLEFSGTQDIGVLQIQRKVIDALATRIPGTKLPRSVLIEAVKFGKAKIGKSFEDVSEEVLSGKQSLVASVEQFVKSRIGGQLRLLERILFVGGGAAALQFELRDRFPTAEFAKDPQMSNARGMFKYGVAVAEDADERLVVNHG